MATALQLNPETKRQFPFWNVQGTLVGNTLGIMVATSVFQVSRHSKY